MRVIAKRTLKSFWEDLRHRDAEEPLKAWYEEAGKADWCSPAEVKAQFATVSIIGRNRLVFNIAGNTYRLIVAVNYKYRCLYVCFLGTHEQYDRVDASEVWDI